VLEKLSAKNKVAETNPPELQKPEKQTTTRLSASCQEVKTTLFFSVKFTLVF